MSKTKSYKPRVHIFVFSSNFDISAIKFPLCRNNIFLSAWIYKVFLKYNSLAQICKETLFNHVLHSNLKNVKLVQLHFTEFQDHSIQNFFQKYIVHLP